MKARFLCLLAIVSFSVFAGQVPQSELNNVNQYISQLLGGFGQFVEIEVTEADRSDDTKLLNSATLSANVLGVANIELGLKTQEKSIVLSGSVEASAIELGLQADDILDLAVDAKKFVDNINAKGDYVAKFKMTGVANGTNLTLTMTPSATNTNPSVNALEIKGFLPNAADEMASVSVTGDLNGGADNVKIVRTAVTNIFNSLAAGQMPEESDFEALSKVIAEMFKALQDIE